MGDEDGPFWVRREGTGHHVRNSLDMAYKNKFNQTTRTGTELGITENILKHPSLKSRTDL